MMRDELIKYLLDKYQPTDDFQWDIYLNGKEGVTFPY
jgi:hypothetical protein